MNKDNYVTLPVSQRLVAAGIVLETEAVWSPIFDFDLTAPGLPVPIKDWELIQKDQITGSIWAAKSAPAPSMSELWRELPGEVDCCELLIGKQDGDCWAAYSGLKDTPYNTNPCDALAELLMALKEQVK
jgi:hypothetical protein